MKLFTCLLISLILMFGFSAAEAGMQEENTNDSSKSDMGGFESWDIHTDSIAFELSSPTIDLQWSLQSRPSINNSYLGDIGAAELRIGFTKKSSNSHAEDILDFSQQFMYLANSSHQWSMSATTDTKLETDSWQFGFGFSGGYGYKLGGDADLTLYHTSGLGWTKVNFKDTMTTNPDINDMIHTLGNEFRFGTMFEGGIKLQVFSPLSLNVAYQRSIVFPRHMFWYWTASEVTEGIGQVFLSHFVDVVMDKSPYAGPVVHFVLKNALSYGFYELRRKHMNWPVQTTAPLMYENYKVGLTFAF